VIFIVSTNTAFVLKNILQKVGSLHTNQRDSNHDKDVGKSNFCC